MPTGTGSARDAREAPCYKNAMRRMLPALVVWALAPFAWAGADFDPANVDWNGGSRLATLAQRAGLRLRHGQVLELGRLDPRDALLFIGPRTPLPEALRAFVRAGGRLGIADDIGPSDAFLRGYGLRRRVPARSNTAIGGIPHLAVAYPRRSHMLLWGVDTVVTNHPASFDAPGRIPLLSFDHGDGLAYLLRDGDGEILVLGDPSILLNQMLYFGDNEHFAVALLRFFARGTSARTVWVFWGDFQVAGSLPSSLQPAGLTALARGARGLAEEAAYGANAVGWELRDQRPLPGVFMALGVFAGGLALLLLAASWGGGATVRLRVPVRRRHHRDLSVGERTRLGVALRREVEERLASLPPAQAGEHARRERLRAEVSRLPGGDADPLAPRLSTRRLRSTLAHAEAVLGPLTRPFGRRRG